MYTEAQGHVLLQLARAAIAERSGRSAAQPVDAEWLYEPGATFVTLTEHDVLRGCIGSLEARRLLHDDVYENAIAAAFHDPRFPPLSPDEFDLVRIEISLLSPPERIQFIDESDALKKLRPHIDGVILQQGQHRATFLPQVWEQLPNPHEFMAHLKHKAGLSSGYLPSDTQLLRYTVQKWKE